MKDKYYKYFNPNPEGNEDAADCVTRALCTVTGLDWYEVYDKCWKEFNEKKGAQ